jgi:hypothetical protein
MRVSSTPVRSHAIQSATPTTMKCGMPAYGESSMYQSGNGPRVLDQLRLLDEEQQTVRVHSLFTSARPRPRYSRQPSSLAYLVRPHPLRECPSRLPGPSSGPSRGLRSTLRSSSSASQAHAGTPRSGSNSGPLGSPLSTHALDCVGPKRVEGQDCSREALPLRVSERVAIGVSKAKAG